jgi:hypothetical protein
MLLRNPSPEDDHILFSQLLDTLSVKEREYYLENVQVSPEEARQICVATVEQNSLLWKKERKVRITASKCYSLHTYTANKSPDWEKKVDSVVNSRFRGTEDTKLGTASEPAARAAYTALTGNKVTQLGLVVNPHAPWLGCSPDGITCVNGEPCLIEIKTLKAGKEKTSEEVTHSCKCIDVEGQLRKRNNYYGQVQLGMELLKINICHFVIYAPFDNSCTVIHVNRDKDFIRELIPTLASVYYAHFLPFLSK